MAAQVTLCQSTLGSLEKFCRSSGPEIEENYPQRLDEDYTLSRSRDICTKLRDYIRTDDSGFCGALRTTPNLEMAFREFLRLQRTLFHIPHSDSSTETRCIEYQSIITPTMSLHNLIDEIGESALYIMELLQSTDMLVC